MSRLLGDYPDNFNGYLVRTNFENALNILECLEDRELSEYERQGQALYMLYGTGGPYDIEEAIKGLVWFLNCGEVKESQSDGTKAYDFNIDSGRIRTSILRNYGIDLGKQSVHWWDFLDMLGDLGECAFTNVVDIRKKDISKFDGEMRSLYSKLKQQFSLDSNIQVDDEESEKIKEFKDLMNK